VAASKTKSKSKRKPAKATTRSTTNPTGGFKKMRPGCWRSGDGKLGRTEDSEQNGEEIAAGFSLSGTDGTLLHGLKKETEPANDENREKNACLGGGKTESSPTPAQPETQQQHPKSLVACLAGTPNPAWEIKPGAPLLRKLRPEARTDAEGAAAKNHEQKTDRN
jgi:hypothetical protein